MTDITEDTNTLEYFLEDHNPFMDYLERIKTKMPLGADIVGATLAKRQSLLDSLGSEGLSALADRLLAAPGDRTLNFGDQNIPARVGLGMPIAYDVWYLFDAGNVLTFGGKTVEESMEKMEQFFSEVDNASPLRSPETPPTVTAYMLAGGTSNGITYDTLGFRQYKVKEARYETFVKGNSESYASTGPKDRQETYCGYIAFPVGPLGVMWGISLVSESAMSSGFDQIVQPVEYPNNVQQGGELLPPFDIERSGIFGEKLMSKGWLVEDDTKVEILADAFEGVDNPELHYWMRYWILPGNTEIIPGEFVGLMCRPWPLHCWWYQETAPFLYAGNWVETEFYTSGIVKEVLDPDTDFTPNSGEVGNRYRVWVKNEELILKSSDWLEYEVDQRVGVLKAYREDGEVSYDASMGPATGSGQETNFNWQHLELQNTGEELNEEWVIVPALFYDESGNNMGGI